MTTTHHHAHTHHHTSLSITSTESSSLSVSSCTLQGISITHPSGEKDPWFEYKEWYQRQLLQKQPWQWLDQQDVEIQSRSCHLCSSSSTIKSLIITANINVHPASRHGQFDFGEAAQRVMCTPNAGGRCLVSEVLSVELVDRLFGVQHLLTEMEIEYATLGPITDYACRIAGDDTGGKTLGVSVTRAMAYQRRFTTQDAWRLVTKKTRGVVLSSASVVGCTFERQILHIWVSSGADAAIFLEHSILQN
ncbi:hypothetical protein K492DRAFT_234526 [Lichtheimia hyalospora FSU 10163]|nr:hypothetical protein K492DRAFT_234526 [Lichtheimia hyalospora FSU 10163]